MEDCWLGLLVQFCHNGVITAVLVRTIGYWNISATAQTGVKESKKFVAFGMKLQVF